jgi:hypothetical protein
MKKISNRLYALSSGWLTLVALVVFLLFTALVLPGQSQQARAEAGEAGSPDLSFIYSADDLYRMAEAYGPDGRQAYIRARFTFDLVWPLVYTFFLATSLSWALRHALPDSSRWRLANLLPVFGAALDYLENVSTSLVMLRYPAATPVVDVLATFFTPAKWTLLGLGFLFLAGGLLLAAWRRVRPHRS